MKKKRWRDMTIWIVHTQDGSVWATKTHKEAVEIAEGLATGKRAPFDKPMHCVITELTIKRDCIWDEYIDRYFPIKNKPGEYQRAALMPV